MTEPEDDPPEDDPADTPTDPPVAVLVTTRLVLRPLTADDLAEYHLLHTDAATFEFERDQLHPHLEYSQTMVADAERAWRDNGLDHWAVRLRGDHRFVGVAGARRMPGDGVPVWSLYYRLHQGDWGQGFATEALRAAAAQIASRHRDAELVATLHPANLRSAGVARALGLRYGYTRHGIGGEAELVFTGPAAGVR